MKKSQTTPREQHTQTCFEIVPIDSISVNPNNARVHPRQQIEKLKSSVSKFGLLTSVVVDENLQLLAGHARLTAARELGYKDIYILRAYGLSEAQKRAFVLADNRIPQDSRWDKEKLKGEINFLTRFDINFDAATIGFDDAAIKHIIGETDPKRNAVFRSVQKSTSGPTCRDRDLWYLNSHRLLCGSPVSPGSYERALGADKAGLIFTDIPPVLPTAVAADGAGADPDMSRTPIDPAELDAALSQVTGSLHPGSIVFLCADWSDTGAILKAARSLKPINICVWTGHECGVTSLYRPHHQFVFVFKYGESPSSTPPKKSGRTRSNVWDYGGASILGTGKQKPVALIADAIKDGSNPGDWILDPFGQDETILMAAEKTKRRAAVIICDPSAADQIIRNWQALTGDIARHAETGKSFDETT